MLETQVVSLGQEDPLEKGMAEFHGHGLVDYSPFSRGMQSPHEGEHGKNSTWHRMNWPMGRVHHGQLLLTLLGSSSVFL